MTTLIELEEQILTFINEGDDAAEGVWKFANKCEGKFNKWFSHSVYDLMTRIYYTAGEEDLKILNEQLIKLLFKKLQKSKLEGTIEVLTEFMQLSFYN